jgi:tetratricopeptide (TPR) repeat protein
VSPNEVAAEPAEAYTRYQSLLASRRVLVVLDNAADAAQVTPLLPANRDCAVLITSRTALTTVDAQQVPVDVFPSRDSLALLGLLAGSARVEAEQPAAAEIARWCGGHPLALRIAGARLAGRPDWSLSQFGARLADRRRRLDELQVADLGVRACFAIGYESLGSDVMAARAFRLLGVLGVPEVGVELVAVLLDVDEVEAERALDRLVEVRLLDPVAGTRFRTHDLLRLYAAELAAAEDPYADRTVALQRALDWYLAMCRRAEAQEFDSFDAEVPCLVAAATQAAEREPAIARFAIDLVPEIRSLAMKRSHWRELEIISDLALVVARRDSDSRGEASTLAITSTMEWRAGRITQARSGMVRALELWREIGDPEGEGVALHNLGWLSMWTNEFDRALEYLTESLRLLRAQNSSKIIIAQHNLSEVLLRLGKHSEAVDSFHACLELRRMYEDKIGESITLVALGRAYCLMDQRADALRALDNAIISCRQVGNRDDEWEALLCRSEIWLREDNPRAAMTDALAVDALTAEIDDDYGQASAARQLARAQTILGDTAAAAESRRRAFSLLASPSMRRDPVLEQVLTDRL